MSAIVPQTMDIDDVVHVLDMIDTSETFDEIAMTRWLNAAIDGGWTVEESQWAVRWLNLHHTGYTTIAVVHKQIEVRRSTLRLARIFCWQHPNALAVIAKRLGRPVDLAAAERFWQDYRYEWLNDGVADAVLATQTDAEWVRWVEAERRNFRSEA